MPVHGGLKRRHEAELPMQRAPWHARDLSRDVAQVVVVPEGHQPEHRVAHEKRAPWCRACAQPHVTGETRAYVQRHQSACACACFVPWHVLHAARVLEGFLERRSEAVRRLVRPVSTASYLASPVLRPRRATRVSRRTARSTLCVEQSKSARRGASKVA